MRPWDLCIQASLWDLLTDCERFEAFSFVHAEAEDGHHHWSQGRQNTQVPSAYSTFHCIGVYFFGPKHPITHTDCEKCSNRRRKKSRVHAAHMHVLRLLERKYRERIWFMAPACGKKSPRCAGWKYFCTYISLCTAVDLACFCYFHCCSTKAKIKWFVQLSKAPRVVQAEITLQKWKTARL